MASASGRRATDRNPRGTADLVALAPPDSDLPRLFGGKPRGKAIQRAAGVASARAQRQGVGRGPGRAAPPCDFAAHQLVKAFARLDRGLRALAEAHEIGFRPGAGTF